MTQLSSKLDWSLANPRWASVLNPILAIPFLNGNQIDNISFKAGVPVAINHLLQRKPQGWIVTDITTASVLFRSAPFNDLTLTLTAINDTTASVWVF